MNSLGKNLRGKVVVLKEMQVTGTTPAIATRLFQCESGAGCDPSSRGVSITGRFLSNGVHRNNTVQIDGSEDIWRFATQSEEAIAL
jgi:hypothetical protein